MNCELFMDSPEIQDKLISQVGTITVEYSTDWEVVEEKIIKEISFLFQTTKNPEEVSIQFTDLVAISSEVRKGHYCLKDGDTFYCPPLFRDQDTPLDILLKELSYQERLVSEIKTCLLSKTKSSLQDSLMRCTGVVENIQEDLKKLREWSEEIDHDLITRAFTIECKLHQLTSC